MKPDDETLMTSWTLVARLKDADDHAGWRDFYGIYRSVILGTAVKAGLRQDEADEVVAETMASVSKHIQNFVADPRHGSFRAWLLNMARWRIRDQFRKRLPKAESAGAPVDDTARTSTLDRIPNQREPNLEELCDAEWQRRLVDMAMEQLQQEVKAEHYQIFHLLVQDGRSVNDVSRVVGVRAPRIHLVKFRLSRRLEHLVKQLRKKFE